MKINQIIREKRKELSLTQEQIAEFLGVSTPAVSKWERGSTYPDITLLPALARLLRKCHPWAEYRYPQSCITRGYGGHFRL